MLSIQTKKANLFENCIGLLRKEVDKLQTAQYFGVECDSDLEVEEDESDAEGFSDDEMTRHQTLDYDLEKMFEIVKKRDFNHWSMQTIHHHYRQINDGGQGRTQISRLKTISFI